MNCSGTQIKSRRLYIQQTNWSKAKANAKQIQGSKSQTQIPLANNPSLPRVSVVVAEYEANSPGSTFISKRWANWHVVHSGSAVGDAIREFFIGIFETYSADL